MTHAEAQYEAEEAQVAIRDGIERARELLCEAKFVIGGRDKAKPAIGISGAPRAEPPNPAV